MTFITDTLKNIDLSKFEEERQKEQEKMKVFWNSSLCQNMIEDMKRVNQGFDAEDFSYFPEKIKSRFGWESINNDDINQFIEVMSDPWLFVDEKIEPKIDEDCMFENYNFVKKGIEVSIMYGQGVSVHLTPKY